MEIKQSYIDSLAPNMTASTNAKGLVNKFLELCVVESESLLFGKCAGSGKNPYMCSMDLADSGNPIARCTCPSRQFPCKHALALLYAYAAGKTFTPAEIPEDIVAKREKLEKRLESKKKKNENTPSPGKSDERKPSKAKISAAIKKIGVQLEGIGVAELILNNMLQIGISGVDSNALKQYELQVKNLGNYYIGGIQNAIMRILLDIREQDGQDYDKAIRSVLYTSALLKRARDYLENRQKAEGAVLAPDISSAIEEQIGHIWKLEELLQYDLCVKNAQLMQLMFYSYADDSRREFVDEGFYCCLNDGNMYITKNYRPYKALKYVKEEDSRYGLIETPELYIYPGDLNPRVRWERYDMSEPGAENMKAIRATAKTDYTDVVKMVKNQIKSPLCDKNPVVLLHVADVVTVRADGAVELHIADTNGVRQILRDVGYIDIPTVPILSRFDKRLLTGNALLVMYANDDASGLLAAKPLAIVAENKITRLVY